MAKKIKKDEVAKTSEKLEQEIDHEHISNAAKLEENFKKNDKKIKAEKQKLIKILKKIDENLLQICDNLLENIAFMSVTLNGLIEIIKANGVKEFYQNGATQSGYKKSVEVDVYNVMQKNYQSSMKLLIDLLSSKSGLDDETKEELKKMFTQSRK